MDCSLSHMWELTILGKYEYQCCGDAVKSRICYCAMQKTQWVILGLISTKKRQWHCH